MGAEMELLHVSPLCLRLTQPAMVAGVSLNFWACALVAVMAAFILFKSLAALVLIVPLYGIGLLLCKLDAHIFIILHKQAMLYDARNKRLWGCQCYEPY